MAYAPTYAAHITYMHHAVSQLPTMMQPYFKTLKSILQSQKSDLPKTKNI